MTKYVGARYMPKFMGLYDNTTSYEALSVVDNGLGTSYVSNKPAPAGTPLTDTEYWSVYGASSGAILDLQNRMTNAENSITNINNELSDPNYTFLKNKSVLIIGDSLSDETVQPPNWVAKLRAKCANLNTVIDNLSIGGSGWCSTNPNTGGLIDQLDGISDIYDYVILFAGINDFNSQFNLGNVGSSDRTTFFGALYQLKNKLHQKCPSAKVFWCTSPHTVIWTQAEKPIPHNRYRSRAYMACLRYSWLMIDTTNLPGYNLIDYRSEYSDGIHPLTSYAQTLCDHIVSVLNAGGETPSIFANKYTVEFDSPYTSSLALYFYNNSDVKLVFTCSDSFSGSAETVVASPDGGYVDGSAIIIPSSAGNIALFMWAGSILIKVPSTLSAGYVITTFKDAMDYDIPNCY